MKKVGTYKIPFRRTHDGRWDMLEYTTSSEGDVVEYKPDTYMGNSAHVWRENKPFVATLKLTGHYRGRSAARVNVENLDNGESYSMALGAFFDAVVGYGVSDGEIEGRWVFRKQGANYGVYPYPDGE